MNESWWSTRTDPEELLDYLYANASNRNEATFRKLRLFACACCRRFWPWLTDERSRNAVETAEHYADGLVGYEELSAAWESAHEATWTTETAAGMRRAATLTVETNSWLAAWAAQTLSRALADAQAPITDSAWDAVRHEERRAQCHLLRDIFGNPFHLVALEPSWLCWKDATIVQIARTIYDDRCFSDLPILADALEEAGCTEAALLGHCREGGEHVRGCWVLDLLSGKA
jgi:hypothetical protein